MNDLTGQTLGQYRIVKPIGRGGMASVYKAYQPSLDRYVAIKVLPPYYAHEPGFAMRFTREAKAVAKLDHPNILPIYDFGQEGDLSYIVMKYVAAGTLKEMMGQPVPPAQATEIIEQIAAALDHAHEQDIIHRDVKPSNVLMDRRQWALLMDFGLAKMVGGSVQLTASGVGVGTPAYMAPEQGQGEEIDHRADVYSLGVMLYEMLTGKVPFDAETPLAVVLKHITAPLPMPRTVNPAIPEAVERVVLKAMAKEPDNRYATAGEMASALRHVVIEGGPGPEIALPSPEELIAPAKIEPEAEEPVVHAPARRKLPRWVYAAGAVALLALVGVVLAAMGLFSNEDSTPEPAPIYTTEGTLGAILFEDDFEGQPSPRWQFSPERWQIEEVDGRTVLHNIPAIENVVAELMETSWGDYAIQFDFRFLRPDDYGEYYLLVRTRFGRNCPPTIASTNSYVLLISPDVLELRQETCDLPGEQPTLTQSDRDLSPDEWHTVQIIAVGNRVRVLVDGQEQIDYSDEESPHLAGSDVIIETENNVEFLLDNFRVYEIVPQDDTAAAPTPLPVPAQPEGPKIVETCEGLEPPELCIRDVKTGRTTKITEGLGFEILYEPVWSPDGQQIAFRAGSASYDDHQLYLINADGSDLKQITHGDEFSVISPDWSPDSEWIAFDGDGQLMLIRPDGSEMHRIVDRAWNRSISQPRWSPGGERIAFFNDLPQEPPEIWIVNRDGSDLRLIYAFEHPRDDVGEMAWSPNGQRIAAGYKENGKDALLFINTDGSGAAQQADVDSYPQSWFPRFWPRWAGGEPEPAAGPAATPLPLEAIDPRGPAPKTLDAQPCDWYGFGLGLCISDWASDSLTRILQDVELEFSSAPSWSPDGEQLVFSALEPGDDPEQPNALYIVNADGSDLLMLPSERNNNDPAWSPDGQWLAFHRNCNLALMHPDGSAMTIVWQHDERCTMAPQWSPDSEWIVFSLVPDGEWTFPMEREVWVISRDGDIITPVATITHQNYDCLDNTVAFGPDNGQIAYFEADCRPMIVNADGSGQAMPLTDFPYWWTAMVHPQWGK